jgi:hypothetical protein
MWRQFNPLKEIVMAEGDNAASGGLLVVLGIVVAVGLAVYFVPRLTQKDTSTVSVQLPNGNGGSATITTPKPANQ